MRRIMLDPAHGGRDPGAIGPTGLQEKVVTLAVAKLVADILSPVAEVRLTREDDRALGPDLRRDLLSRSEMANKWGADVFISIHCNSAENRTAWGAEVYTTPGQGQADILAESIMKRIEAQLPELLFRKDKSDGDSDKEAWFAVLKETKMPACLVELAFISNPAEESLLKNLDFQARAASSIAEGVAGYMGLEMPAADPKAVRIVVAGKVLQGKLIGDITWVPVRAMANAMGRKLEWDEASRTVMIK